MSNNLSQFQKHHLVRLSIAALFLVLIFIYTSSMFGGLSGGFLLISASVIGGYMAMNIGANDVANNVGPAVGAGALKISTAIVIAAIFEAAGAMIAGGDVISTIKKGIIDPGLINDTDTFIWLMIAALLAGALWLNIATAVGAPVSTTHSIVGGVLGAGIAAGGMDIANWTKMSQIAASWVISPVLGGVIAAAFLYSIKRTITYRKDKLAAAKKMVPLLIAIMAMAFTTYLVLKGLKKVWKPGLGMASLVGLVGAVITYVYVRPIIARAADKLTNEKTSINILFTLPLIFSAALLSFAHGANDVANSIGPLAAINDAIVEGVISKKAGIPIWVMLIGAIGISIGLALYGPKLIRTVGSEITELNQTRAFCIAMAASITVIIASQLGLPVSSTHIAVGAIFGVGFLREALKTNYDQMLAEIRAHHEDSTTDETEAFLRQFEEADIDEKTKLLHQLKSKRLKTDLSKKETKRIKKVVRKELVKRSTLYKIAAAWIITVPASALMAAMIYFMIRGMML